MLLGFDVDLEANGRNVGCDSVGIRQAFHVHEERNDIPCLHVCCTISEKLNPILGETAMEHNPRTVAKTVGAHRLV